MEFRNAEIVTVKQVKIRGIRVIKRIDIEVAGKPQVSVDHPDAQSRRRSIVAAVGNWISERSENRRAEAAFSTRKIRTWKSPDGQDLGTVL